MALRKFIVERNISSVGSLGAGEPKGAAVTSKTALAQLAPEIQWVQSYVAADNTFSVYLAKEEGTIRRHAEITDFPAIKITEIIRIIDPTTEPTG